MNFQSSKSEHGDFSPISEQCAAAVVFCVTRPIWQKKWSVQVLWQPILFTAPLQRSSNLFRGTSIDDLKWVLKNSLPACVLSVAAVAVAVYANKSADHKDG